MPNFVPPSDLSLVHRLLDHLGLSLPEQDPGAQVQRLAFAFGHLPYENLSKVLAWHQTGEIQLEAPAEVIENHLKFGTGGTCFSLTHTLVRMLQSLGIDAHPILADRSYGTDTHAAVLVQLDGKRAIVDPGYLIFEPIAIDSPMTQVRFTPVHRLELVPTAADRWELFTCERPAGRSALTAQPASNLPVHPASQSPTEKRTYRLTYKAIAADPADFERAWRSSFSWDMMRYPVVSGVIGQTQVFARGGRWQVRRAGSVERQELDRARWSEKLTQELGIAPEVIEAAWHAFEQRPE